MIIEHLKYLSISMGVLLVTMPDECELEYTRRLAQYENTLSPNCSRHCEIKKICVCGEVFTQRHYDYMAKEKKKLSEKQKPALYICDYCRLDYKGRDRDASENVDLVCDSCNVNYFKEEEEENE